MKPLLFLGCMALSAVLHAQPYGTSLGVRTSWSNLQIAGGDFSLKQFISAQNAFEINLGAGRNYAWIQGMYDYEIRLPKRVYGYIGMGPDIGYWKRGTRHFTNDREYSGWWFGTTANAGIEYVFPSFPLSLAVDAGPTMRFIPYLKMGVMTGCSIRFILP